MAAHADATEIHKGAYVQSGDPGAVGAGKLWVDTNTTPPKLKKRNSGNTDWDLVAVADHGHLQGLADDDHSQYHNDTRGDARYVLKTIPDAKGDLFTATAADTPARLAAGSNGQVLVADSTQATGLKYEGKGVGLVEYIDFPIPHYDAAMATGVAGDVSIPFACTINSVRLLADVSGSIVVDIWKDTYANYPPTVADTITASAKPTLSSATKSEDTTLTGWTTSIAAGDILRFNVDSFTTVGRVLLSLKVTRT